jgi:hypothetical protein
MDILNTQTQLMTGLLVGPKYTALLIVLLVWSLIWKGIALWKAAQNGSKVWYIIMLVANTVGILEIIYIFFFSKKKEKQVA